MWDRPIGWDSNQPIWTASRSQWGGIEAKVEGD